MSTSLPSRVFCPCSSKAAFLHSPTSRGTGENAKEAGLGVRTHSSTANSSSVSAVSHCLALVRFSCVMLERLPRSLPSATIELVDHRQGCAQHLVLENSFRLGRAGAAPRQWRRNRGLLYPGNLDMVTEDKATITLEKYREEVRRNNRGQIDCRPAIGSTAARICSELLRLLFLHAHRQTSRPVAPLRSWMSECNQTLPGLPAAAPPRSSILSRARPVSRQRGLQRSASKPTLRPFDPDRATLAHVTQPPDHRAPPPDLGSQPLPQRRWKCGSHGHSLHKVTPRWRWKWGTQAAKKEVTSHAGLGVAMRTAAFTPVRFFAQRLVFSDLALSSSLSSIQS